jgi:hypothetical protein
MDPPTEEEIKAQAEGGNISKKKPVPQDEPTLEPESVSNNNTAPDESSMPSAAPPLPPLNDNDTNHDKDNDQDMDQDQDKDMDKDKDNTERTTSSSSSSTTLTSSSPGTKETLLPSSAQPRAIRSVQFLELRSYEAKRRTIYTTKHKSTSLYWRAFRSLLSKSYQETDRAVSLVRGTVHANETYSKFLQAAADDRLDDSGRPVDERRGRRLQEDRRKKYSSLGGGSLLMGFSMEMDRKSAEKERERIKKKADYASINSDITGGSSGNIGSGSSGSDHHAATSAIIDANHNDEIAPAISFEGLPEDSLITTLVESQFQMAQVFTENAAFVKDVVLDKLIELKKELEAEVSVMSALGDATIHELEKAEDDVQKAWCKLLFLLCMLLFCCCFVVVVVVYILNGMK